MPPERQKILNLIKGALPADELPLSTMNLSQAKLFLVVGTPEGKELQRAHDLPDILNDWVGEDFLLAGERLVSDGDSGSRFCRCFEEDAATGFAKQAKDYGSS